jgi:hypothetical protein
MRSNYWTCSKFADWLRGTAKPKAATSQGWSEWTKEAKAKHPVRFWIADDGLDYIQNTVMWLPDKLNDVRYYINNRWVSQTHGLYAHSLEKGKFHEYETRLLHSMFDQLVDFVEIEQAWHHVLWDEEARKRFNVPWWRSSWLRWRTWRCPDAGIEYLIWASGLTHNESWGIDKDSKYFGKPTSQAFTAKELLELYRWWKIDRPARPDPYEVSGWSDICARRRDEDPDSILGREDKTPAEKKASRESLKMVDRLEKQYEKEDEAMMIRLIKIRRGLWT